VRKTNLAKNGTHWRAIGSVGYEGDSISYSNVDRGFNRCKPNLLLNYIPLITISPSIEIPLPHEKSLYLLTVGKRLQL